MRINKVVCIEQKRHFSNSTNTSQTKVSVGNQAPHQSKDTKLARMRCEPQSKNCFTKNRIGGVLVVKYDGRIWVAKPCRNNFMNWFDQNL